MLSSAFGIRRCVHVVVKNNTLRGMATIRIDKHERPLAAHIIANMPIFEDEHREEIPLPDVKYKQGNVTSTHAIDVKGGQISSLDSAIISPSGSIVHGRYGDLGDVALGIPLEYLALLRPAAEGAAALRVITDHANTDQKKGTILVCNATEANGLAASQLASAAGNAVVAVVGHEHQGNQLMMDCVKGFVNEPGTALPAVYALSKKKFIDLVEGIATGDDVPQAPTADEYLEDFKANALKYAVVFPEEHPAAVDEERFKFLGMEKDREDFRDNMEAYLEQYNPGSPNIQKPLLDVKFTKEQYEIFRTRFWEQTTNLISGDRCPFFSPPHIIKELIEQPQHLESNNYEPVGPKVPYAFSILNQYFPDESNAAPGGPVIGAAIAVTPDLESAAKRVDAETTLRGKAEALQFLTSAQRTAFGAACSVAAIARKAGAPVYAIGGSLPGIETVEPTEEDVTEALAAMDIDDDGETRLNYFVQVYRACDFPFYGKYAIHRASEELAGPRQIIVAK